MPEKPTRSVPRTFNPEAPRQPHRFPPLGQELSPWPQWQLRTFVNEWLIRESPIETRRAVFQDHYQDQSWWLKADSLLESIEREAERVLREDPPELNWKLATEMGFSKDDLNSRIRAGKLKFRDCLQRLTEEQFGNIFQQDYRKQPGEAGRFTHSQASAIAALRGICVIWQLTGAHHDGSGKIRLCDPAQEETYDSVVTSRIAMEVALVIVNAIRGEFLDVHESLIERGAAAIRGARARREDNLNRVILKELQAGGLKQPALKILAEIEKKTNFDDRGIIYEIDDDSSVSWYDKRGVLRETPFHAFEKRVSKLKKRLQLQK